MDFGRVLTAMVTPMYENGEVNYDESQRLAEYLLNNGSDGLVVAGTTGEGATLSNEEKLRLFSAVLEVTRAHKAPLIAGTSNNDTADTIELSLKAEALGVSGLLVVTPYYNKPPQESMYAHFAAIDAAVHIPIMLYNVPSRTNNNLAAATLQRLAVLPHVAAIKEASGNMEQMSAYRRQTPADFLIYSGEDTVLLPMLALGANGVVSVASHIIGRQLREMIVACEKQELQKAAELHYRYFEVCRKLFVTTNPMPVKYAMSRLGFAVGPCRLPMTWVNESEAAVVDSALTEIGLL